MSNNVTITIEFSNDLLKKVFTLDRKNKLKLVKAKKEAVIDLFKFLTSTAYGDEDYDSCLERADEYLEDDYDLVDQDSLDEDGIPFQPEDVALDVVTDSEEDMEADFILEDPDFDEDMKAMEEHLAEQADSPNSLHAEKKMLELLKAMQSAGCDDDVVTPPVKKPSAIRCKRRKRELDEMRNTGSRVKRRTCTPVDEDRPSLLKQTLGVDGKDVAAALQQIVRADNTDPVHILENVFNKVCQASVANATTEN